MYCLRQVACLPLKERTKLMNPLQVFAIISWIALPTVMFGGYSLLRLMSDNDEFFTPFRLSCFRAGHAHAGILLVLSLVYYVFMGQTGLQGALVWGACIVLMVGTLTQSGGFFLHMIPGAPGRGSAGTVMTSVGAVLLVLPIILLVYGLITVLP